MLNVIKFAIIPSQVTTQRGLMSPSLVLFPHKLQHTGTTETCLKILLHNIHVSIPELLLHYQQGI